MCGYKGFIRSTQKENLLDEVQEKEILIFLGDDKTVD